MDRQQQKKKKNDVLVVGKCPDSQLGHYPGEIREAVEIVYQPTNSTGMTISPSHIEIFFLNLQFSHCRSKKEKKCIENQSDLDKHNIIDRINT